jgi:galactokinase
MSATNANILETVEKGNREFLEENTYIADINAVLYAKRKHFVLTDNATGTSQLIPFSYTDKTFVITDAKVPRIPVWPEEIIRTEQNFSLLSSLKRQKGDVWEYESSESEINDVLQELNEDMRKRLFYIIKEHYYVNEGVQALREDNFSLFARYVNKSHESLRDLYQLSCPEIDWLIKRAMELSSPSTRTPTVCSRIAGKGFGDCTFAFIPKEVVEKYLQKLTDYERIFGFQPVAYIVKPAGTVKFLKIQEK